MNLFSTLAEIENPDPQPPALEAESSDGAKLNDSKESGPQAALVCQQRETGLT